MSDVPVTKLAPQDGDWCYVLLGTHAGKSGKVQDLHTSKTGHVTLTVVQATGVRFKTLARNVRVLDRPGYPHTDEEFEGP